MALNIALSPFRDVDPETQPIPRRFVGYDPKLGDEQLWNANRGAYDLDESAAEEQFATFSYDGTIRLVASATVSSAPARAGMTPTPPRRLRR